jgi:type II restriction enzyme
LKLGFEEQQTSYSSGSQNAKAWTERWVRDWVFCPNCGANNIQQYTANKPVADFFCTNCSEDYELKSQKKKFGNKVVDGAFGTMCARLESLNNPNFLLLNYDIQNLAFTNLFVVPKHFFVKKIIEERPPLAATARRAGWIGCNILLGQIPEAGRIFVIRNGAVQAKEAILEQWQKTIFLRKETEEARGWLLDVMSCVEKIGKTEFQIDDVYVYENYLSNLYPNNRHVKQKIRQQLQVLRDQGYLDFKARGFYSLR